MASNAIEILDLYNLESAKSYTHLLKSDHWLVITPWLVLSTMTHGHEVILQPENPTTLWV